MASTNTKLERAGHFGAPSTTGTSARKPGTSGILRSVFVPCRRGPQGALARSSQLLVVALVIALALNSSASAVPATSTESPAPRAQEAQLSPAARWFRNVARRYLTRKVDARRITKKVAKEAFKEWLESEATSCPSPLPDRFFCPEEPSRLGVGIALRLGDRLPGVWTSPVSPRRLLGPLRQGGLYWLSCHRYGDRSVDGVVATSLWYRLLDGGGWVNDGWLYTGTDDPISGVKPC